MQYLDEEYADVIQRLVDKYPKMFPNERIDISIGSGWLPIIESLCAHIQNYVDWREKTIATLTESNPYNTKIPEVVPQVVVGQIKEKFGGLRFYYDGGDHKVDGMVAMAEAWAAHTCEECGNMGKHRNSGWMATLCDEHHEKREKLRNERSI